MSKHRNKKRAAAASTRSLTAWVVFAILFFVTLAAYCNSFTAPMVFDDMTSIQANAAVRSGFFDWQPLKARWFLFLTFTLNSVWTGQEVWSYHVVNFLLH